MAEQVFICYARQDEDFVLKLAGALKAQGVPVWIDQWELPVGADWDLEIEEALKKSSHLLLVLSPASMKSREVRDEWRWVLKRRKPIIPVLFQECELHRRLDSLHHIDFTSRPPTDAAAVSQVVSALGMERRAVEQENRLPAVSEEPSAGRLRPGATLQGRYVVMEKISQGGIGAVYVASDLHIRGKVWALKELDFSAFSSMGERLKAWEHARREFEPLARLDHPNIVKVADPFDEQGSLYTVMEFLHGGMTLDQILSREGGPLAVERVLRWVVQICDALSYLHAQNPPIIYRGLKPETVYEIASTNQIKLTDFSIARFNESGLQRDETVLGTPGYAPPEQYGKGQTDARSDLYALGAMLHQLLTGRDPAVSPFQFPPVRSLNSAVPEGVETAIHRALNMHAEERFQTAEEMKRALLRGA